MRTALRATLATAVLAGALLSPAAGAAYAATTTVPQAATVTSQNGPDRFAGTPVHIGEGLVAVLRHEAEGPEAWIRAVGPDWKPGENYMFRVLTVLDRMNITDTVNGLDVEITEVDTAAPVLTVTKADVTRSFPMPLSEAGRVHGAKCVSVTKRLGLDGTLVADVTTTPDGPQVQLVDGVTHHPYKKLTRTGPALAKGDLTVARILNPNSADPSFEYATPGRPAPFETALFPELPRGCTFTFPFTDEAPLPEPTATPSAEPTATATSPTATTPAATGSSVKTQTAGQTTVVPKGGVAAGAELAEDGDDSTSALAGAGLIAILGTVGTALLVLRRRGGAQR
ncbi:hypothetical protein [Streptomyces sp. NPDC054849]